MLTSVSVILVPPTPTAKTTTVVMIALADLVSKWSVINVKILTSVLMVITSVTPTPIATTQTDHTVVLARPVSLETVAAVLNSTPQTPTTKSSMLTAT